MTRDYAAKARRFEQRFNVDWEDEAQAQRVEFLRRFPVKRLARLKMEDYALGQNSRETFCYWVEPGTSKWARIVGAKADKFGVYFGKKKSDPQTIFRYSQKFSRDLPREGFERLAFKNVRNALVELVRSGEKCDFSAIDQNPLSPMFKAKILSLYFPDKYLAICSKDNLLDLASHLNLENESIGSIQYEVLQGKRVTSRADYWTPLMYASFLWEEVLGKKAMYRPKLQKSTAKSIEANHKEVNFEELMRKWREIGAKSEAYALKFEQGRLQAKGLGHLSSQIKDRTKKPKYGYDFESFTSAKTSRFIEVKTLARYGADGSRFFISEHERSIAKSHDKSTNYYFYLVIYQGEKPVDIQIRKGGELLDAATLRPQNYLVYIPK